jgi:hypothetical protein
VTSGGYIVKILLFLFAGKYVDVPFHVILCVSDTETMSDELTEISFFTFFVKSAAETDGVDKNKGNRRKRGNKNRVNNVFFTHRQLKLSGLSYTRKLEYYNKNIPKDLI